MSTYKIYPSTCPTLAEEGTSIGAISYRFSEEHDYTKPDILNKILGNFIQNLETIIF